MVRKQTQHPVDWKSIRQLLDETAELLDEGEKSSAIREQILERRAQRAAVSAVQYDAPSMQQMSVLQINMGEERYVIPVQSVRRIAEIGHLTPVPCVPLFYRGVANLRGRVISVLDLRVLFETIPPSDTLPEADYLMVVVIGAGLEIGLLAESVSATTPVDSIAWTGAQHLGYDMSEGITAVASDGLILLDIDSLFRDPRLRIYEEISW